MGILARCAKLATFATIFLPPGSDALRDVRRATDLIEKHVAGAGVTDQQENNSAAAFELHRLENAKKMSVIGAQAAQQGAQPPATPPAAMPAAA